MAVLVAVVVFVIVAVVVFVIVVVVVNEFLFNFSKKKLSYAKFVHVNCLLVLQYVSDQYKHANR